MLQVVVAVDKLHIAAAGLVERVVARCTHAGIVLDDEMYLGMEQREGRHLVTATIGRAIVHHQHLIGVIGQPLGDNRAQATIQITLCIIDRNDVCQQQLTHG